MKKIFAIQFIVTFFTVCYAQKNIDLYNFWLKSEKLNNFIYAESFENIFQDNKNYKILNLKFNTSNSDSAYSFWQSLIDYYSKNSKTKFTEHLFYHYLYLEKSTRPDTLVIKITDINNCITGFIFFDEISKNVIDTISFCLNQTRKFLILTDKILIDNQIELDDNLLKNAVFDKILNFNETFFKKNGGFFNKYSLSKVYFETNYIEGDEELKFTVGGLKQEVLNNYGDPFVCWLLKYFYEDNSCYPWEYLQFIITFESYKTHSVVTISIEGKISDGTSNKPTTWYRAKPMEPQFTDYLEIYADMYKRKLYSILQN